MENNYNIFSGYDPTFIPANIKECFAKLTLSSTKKKVKNPDASEGTVDDEASPKHPSAQRNILQELITDDESEENDDEVNKLFLSFNSRKTCDKSDVDANTDQSTENRNNSIFSERLEVSNTDDEKSANEPVIGVLKANTSGHVLKPSTITKTRRLGRRSKELFSQKPPTEDVFSLLSSKVDNLNIRSPIADERHDLAQLRVVDHVTLASTSTDSAQHDQSFLNECRRNAVALASTLVDSIQEDQSPVNEQNRIEVALASTLPDSTQEDQSPANEHKRIEVAPGSTSTGSAQGGQSFVNERKRIAVALASTLADSTQEDQSPADEHKRIEVALADTVTSEVSEIVSNDNQRRSFPTKKSPPALLMDKSCGEISILTISSTVSSISGSSFDISETDNEVIEISDSEPEQSYVDNVSSIVPSERAHLPPTISITTANRLDDFLNDVAKKIANPSEETSQESIVNISQTQVSVISSEESLEIPETSSEQISRNESVKSSQQNTPDKKENSDNIKISKETEDKDTNLKHSSFKVTHDIENGIERINISAKIKIKLHISEPVLTELNESSEELSNDQEEQEKLDQSSSLSREKSTSHGQESQHAISSSKSIHNSFKTPEKHKPQTPEQSKESSVEKNTDILLDEKAQQLLNKLYGKEWQTPEILNINKKINKSEKIDDSCLNFTIFHKDIRSDLESTRFNLDENSPTFKAKPVNAFKKPLDRIKTPQEKRAKAVETPKTTRKGRKVRKRIENLNLSSTDEDFNASDDSWIDTSSSNSSNEDVPKTNRKERKKKKEDIIYLDLTDDFIQVQKEYKSPPANNDKGFNDRLKNLLETCRSVDKPQLGRTPNSARTKRKLFTPRYGDEHEDLIPLNDDLEKLQIINDIEEDFVRIRDPLPAKFELVNKQLEAVKTGTPIFSVKKDTVISKKNRTPATPKSSSPKPSTPCTSTRKKTPLNEISQTPKDKYGFLKSLDVSVAKEFCHPDALHYRDNYKTRKDDLAQKLFKMYNEKLFNNELDTSIIWNKKLTNTAGRCSNKRKGGKRFSVIELSEKVLTSADRLRCTLMHELCHAATWIFNGEHGHGATWKSWANKANIVFPELPKIGVCHQYEIEYKYTYRCTLCGAKSHAHSKSKKAENIRCSFCHGAIEIFLNKRDKEGNVMLTPVKEPVGFAKFVKEKYKLFKKPELKHADVMKLLSNEFASLSVTEKKKY